MSLSRSERERLQRALETVREVREDTDDTRRLYTLERAEKWLENAVVGGYGGDQR